MQRRYLSARQFSQYCLELNVSLKSSNQELELYEKMEIFFPSARIVQPDDYVRFRQLKMEGVEVAQEDFSKWNEIDSLLFGKNSPCDKDGSEAWHRFDYEFEHGNSFLFRPEGESFLPWENYRCWIKPSNRDKYLTDTAKHYYHAWQVHHLYVIKERYPLLAKYYWLLQDPSDKQKERVASLIPDRDNPIVSFWKKTRLFEALSFYAELYENERNRTLYDIINDEQYEVYQKNLENHAHVVTHKFNLQVDELYNFLRELLDLHTKYESKEKYKLADELEKEIRFLTRLISAITGASFYDIEHELRKTPPEWTAKKFRHFDKATEVYDHMEEEFERMLPSYNGLFPDSQITFAEVKLLSKFLNEKNLFILPYALFDLHQAVNDSKRFRKISLYTGMSNLTTGMESFLRTLAIIVNNNFSMNIEIGTMHPLIKTMFPWGKKFQRAQDRMKRQNKSDGIAYLVDVFTDNGIEDIVKVFLLVHGTRNLISHDYNSKQELYGRLFAHLYDAVAYSLLYSWSYALKEQWI